MGAGRNLSRLILKTADHLRPIKTLKLHSVWCFYIVHCTHSQRWLLIYIYIYIFIYVNVYIYICKCIYFFVKCVVDCFPVSQSTELLHSNDQFAHSYSDSYELWYISVPITRHDSVTLHYIITEYHHKTRTTIRYRGRGGSAFCHAQQTGRTKMFVCYLFKYISRCYYGVSLMM